MNFYLATTRFNCKTYSENIDYRIKNDLISIYGTCVKIQNKYSPDAIMFIIEMNNETNRIEGIGLIRNRLIFDKHKIYDNMDYNRYIYSGKYWLSRSQILSLDQDLVYIFEIILFKGKSHVKRHAGISIITDKLLTNWNFDLQTLKNRVKMIFIQEYRNKADLQNISLYSETENLLIEI
jgi:hypothetical protein